MNENTTNRLEKKLDGLIEDMATVKTTLFEREKTETLREEVIRQAMKTQDGAMSSIENRVCKLEKFQDKVIWLIVSTVMLAVTGSVIATNMIK